MTKERKLAIVMWEGIKKAIKEDNSINIKTLKTIFCQHYNLPWTLECWFCTYIPDCVRCPIYNKYESECSIYWQAADTGNTKTERIRACNKIIKALKGGKK